MHQQNCGVRTARRKVLSIKTFLTRAAEKRAHSTCSTTTQDANHTHALHEVLCAAVSLMVGQCHGDAAAAVWGTYDSWDRRSQWRKQQEAGGRIPTAANNNITSCHAPSHGQFDKTGYVANDHSLDEHLELIPCSRPCMAHAALRSAWCYPKHTAHQP